MKTELLYFRVFPKIVKAHSEGHISIQGRGAHATFDDSIPYTITVVPLNETNLNEPERPYAAYEVYPRKGVLCFTHSFGAEGQYHLLVKPGDKAVESAFQRRQRPPYLEPQKFRIYAVREDLFALRPWMGDMHVHTFYSDGKEEPAVVAANYRKAGFDFLAITDHEQYEPSLEAIAAFKDVPVDLKLFPGEEVHPPANNTHYVHFAGSFSINAVFRNDPERYKRECDEIAGTFDLPPGINPKEYASCVWVGREIKKAGGMSIMVHPHWIQDDAYHVSGDMCMYMLRNQPLDAFELTGGQFQAENQMQLSIWQQLRAEGFSIPIVGSSDSHSTEQAITWFNISKMVILAPDCTKESIIKAVHDKKVVVLEQYHGEPFPRLYGEYRYTAFALFLLEEFFPLHDELCFEEGRLMKEYVTGDKSAADFLENTQGRCAALMEKCWGASGLLSS